MSVRACPVSHGVDWLSQEFIVDPYGRLAQLRAESPVLYDEELDHFIVTRYADIEQCLLDRATFLAKNASSPVTSCARLGENTLSAKPITLGFSAWPGWIPWQVAAEKGLFEQNGITVDLRYFDNYTDSLTALTNGDIEANSQTLNDTLSSVTDGSRETIVLVNDNSTGNDQIIAKPGIRSVSGLKGRTVAAEAWRRQGRPVPTPPLRPTCRSSSSAAPA